MQLTLLAKYSDGCGECRSDRHIRLPWNKLQDDYNRHYNDDDQKPDDFPKWPQEILAIVIGFRYREEVDKWPGKSSKRSGKVLLRVLRGAANCRMIAESHRCSAPRIIDQMYSSRSNVIRKNATPKSTSSFATAPIKAPCVSFWDHRSNLV